MKRIFAILIMLLPLVCGCIEKEKTAVRKQQFIIVRPTHNVYGKPCNEIRFATNKKKDDETVAMEKIAGQWNRNLYIGDRYQSLEEYVAKYRQNP